MKRCLLLLAAVLVAAPAAPATAAPAPFRSPQPACVSAPAAVADGTVYGAGDCGGRVTVLRRRPGAAWQPVAAAWRAQRVEAVAVDATGVYVVMSCGFDAGEACGAPAPQGKAFSIGKVPFGGGPTPLTRLGSSESGDTATVAARDGRWWAAWTETLRDYDQPGSGSQVVRWRKTVGGAGQGVVPVPSPPEPSLRVFSYDPQLALTGSGAALAFVTRVDREGSEPVLQLATAGPEGSFTTSAFEPAAGAPAHSPDVAYSGGRLFVAWARAGRPALAFERDGALVRADLPHRGSVRDLALSASGGRAAVVTSEEFAYAGGWTTRVYARAFDTAARLQSTTDLTAPMARTDPQVRGVLHEVTAARGLATVAFAAGGRTWTASQS